MRPLRLSLEIMMTDSQKKMLIGLSLLGLGVLLFMKRREISELASAALDSANDELFRLSLPSNAQPYSDVIKRVSSETGMDPFIIAAIGERESRWGNALHPRGPAGTGDNGYGHGLMQIDSRTWSSWLSSHDWTDPYTNIRKGAEILSSNMDYFAGKGLEGDEQVQAALAAYNRGPGNVWAAIEADLSPDWGTAGGNYASDVWARFQNWAGNFAVSLGLA